MTIAVSFSTVADSISKLTVTGVTMKDIDEIPPSGNMLTPIMFPNPDSFITNLSVTRMSLGGGGAAALDMTYVMNYVFLQSRAGAGISPFDAYSKVITNLAVILVAMLTNDNITGPVDFEVNDIGNIGVIEDPAGKQFWGVLLSFKVTEHVQ
jgi:hypothetical protein